MLVPHNGTSKLKDQHPVGHYTIITTESENPGCDSGLATVGDLHYLSAGLCSFPDPTGPETRGNAPE